MCGGTDCHGDRKPIKHIGTGFGDMNISEDIINNIIMPCLYEDGMVMLE